MKIKFLPLSFVFFFCAVSVALADGSYNLRGLAVPFAPTPPLTHWQAALANTQQGVAPTTIVWLGDSWSNAELLNSPVRSALQAKYGNSGFGYIAMDYLSTSTPASGVLRNRTGSWVDGGMGQSSASINSAKVLGSPTSTYTVSTTTGTDFTVYYGIFSGGSNFTAQVDATTPALVVTDALKYQMYDHSEDFTSWTAQGGTAALSSTYPVPALSSGETFATTTAFTEDGTNGFHYLITPVGLTLVSGTNYQHVMYAHAGSRSTILFQNQNGGFSPVYFSLSGAGSVLLNTYSGSTATITSIGSGWYKCVVTAVGTASGDLEYWGPSNGTAITYLGNAGAGGPAAYFSGGQAGIIATQQSAYIPAPVSGSLNWAGVQTIITGLTNGTHVTVFTVGSGLTGAYLHGVEVNINTPGVKVHRIPASGCTYTCYTGVTPGNWETNFKQLNPDLVVIQLGVNELNQNVTPANQVNGYITMVNEIRTAVPTADILLVPPPDIGLTATYSMFYYQQAQRSTAYSKGWGYVDTAYIFGLYSSSSLRTPTLWTNSSHVNVVGGQLLGNIVSNYLLNWEWSIYPNQ